MLSKGIVRVLLACARVWKEWSVCCRGVRAPSPFARFTGTIQKICMYDVFMYLVLGALEFVHAPVHGVTDSRCSGTTRP